jgi:DNA-binding response OmpR family regulator
MELLAREGLRIVQVEDDCDFAHLSKRFLKRAGFNRPIVHWDDGLPAIRYFLTIEPELAPDAVLLDLHLPRMNGLEVLRWLRQKYRECDIAVYMLSSSDEPLSRQQAAAIGVTEFFTKSSSFDQLIEALDRLIATRNSERVKGKPVSFGHEAKSGPRRPKSSN